MISAWWLIAAFAGGVLCAIPIAVLVSIVASSLGVAGGLKL